MQAAERGKPRGSPWQKGKAGLTPTQASLQAKGKRKILHFSSPPHDIKGADKVLCFSLLSYVNIL